MMRAVTCHVDDIIMPPS